MKIEASRRPLRYEQREERNQNVGRNAQPRMTTATARAICSR
jgi:hypothetical protein